VNVLPLQALTLLLIVLWAKITEPDAPSTPIPNGFGLIGAADPNSTGALTVGVSDSVVANNVGGVVVNSSSSNVSVLLTRVLVAGNETGLESLGSQAVLWLAQSTLTGNSSEFAENAGAINSYVDNYAVGKPDCQRELGHRFQAVAVRVPPIDPQARDQRECWPRGNCDTRPYCRV
jgi:hypothetical protein